MQLSTFQLTTLPHGTTATAAIDETLQAVVSSEALGYKNVWLAEHVSYKGDYYHLQNATLALSPFQRPHPPIAIACGSSEAAIHVAAAGYAINLAGNDEMLKERIDAYTNALQHKGHIGVLKNICITDDQISAERARQAAATFVGLMTGKTGGPIDFFLDLFFIIGTLAEVEDRLQALADLGVDEILCSLRWGNLKHGEVCATMRQLSTLIPSIS